MAEGKRTVRSRPAIFQRTAEEPEPQEATTPRYVRQNVYLAPSHLEAYETARAEYRRQTGKRLEISAWVRAALDKHIEGESRG